MDYASKEEATYYWAEIKDKVKDIVAILGNENVKRANLIMEKVKSQIDDRLSHIILFPFYDYNSPKK